MKLSRETSRNRFLKLTTVKFTVSERPYTSESRKLESFETDHPQSLIALSTGCTECALRAH